MRPIALPLFCLFTGLILMAHMNAQAKIYKWTDANGVVHYSENPPPTQDQEFDTMHSTGGGFAGDPLEPAELTPDVRRSIIKVRFKDIHLACPTKPSPPVGIPIHAAAARGDLAAVKRLCSQGVPVDLPTQRNSTPLMFACDNYKREVARWLVDAGADVNARNLDGLTPLMAAARIGDQDILAFLASRGAKIDLADKNGVTPMHSAAECGSLQTLRLLLENGADVNVRDQEGAMPLHLAARQPQPRAVRWLLLNGAVPTAKTRTGATPLHEAVTFCEEGLVEMLLIAGADPRARDDQGRTALMLLQGPEARGSNACKAKVKAMLLARAAP